MIEKASILFSGMLAGDPGQGGAVWAALQFVLGLRRLGHRVWVVEPVKGAKLRPAGVGLAQSENAAYFRDVVRRFGLEGAAALSLEGTQETVGASYADLCEFA